ncbi:Histidinol dehydrogenase [hydrothermal vent metagenome]|uniref:Histidinol dehydrogenase n=1 Tax=hydrothermal vent metagenome TaxID=652676 RepID=A0A3B0WHK9_9ZZZZ
MSDSESITVAQLEAKQADFWQQLDRALAWESVSDEQVFTTVNGILSEVKKRGDAAIIEYTNKFDRVAIKAMSELEVSRERLNASLNKIPSEQRDALEQAATRVRAYAEHQKIESWSYTEADGTFLGQQVTPMDRAGLYVPGGKAAYPSSVIMNAIPAKVAGVPELIMVVPTPDGEVNDLVFAAAAIAEIDRVFTIGGAQAIAALAYGTETIPQVDKIVGPGNIYVATAKRMVFGAAGIDMIAGPSEICIVCDGKTPADWIAMDLFSQAEHDEDAQSILVSPDADFIEQVKASINELIKDMPRAEIIKKSLNERGILIEVADMQEAINVVNYIAPEHLELSIDNAREWSQKVHHAGAIFMGRYTAEALGDYCAGPNHVLPTSRTARFSSPLGVYDFQKRSSLIDCSEAGASKLAKIASVLAYGEGLAAHARSAEYRIKK